MEFFELKLNTRYARIAMNRILEKKEKECNEKVKKAFVEGARWWMDHSGAKVSPLTFEEMSSEEFEKRYK